MYTNLSDDVDSNDCSMVSIALPSRDITMTP